MNYGVHKTHCCWLHGCKYGDPDCPVTNGIITQYYLCESCTYDGFDQIPKPANELLNINSPQCSESCIAIKELGVSECKHICPHKFKNI